MATSNAETQERQGRCHCGAVRFRVTLTEDLASARRCNCSYCGMRGAVALSAPLGHFSLTVGADKLSRYRFNTGAAAHYSWSVCGIYTHHQRRSNPDQYGINAACLEGVGPFDFAAVEVFDGVNHVRDMGPDAKPRRVGVLRFERD